MIHDQLTSELKEAMKSGDSSKASALRMLISALHNREIEKRGKGEELSEQDRLDVLKKELKKRNESSAVFREAGRTDLAEHEAAEALLISGFLPPEMSDEDLARVVEEVLGAHPGADAKSFGIIMKEVVAKTQGQVDGSRISALLKQKLS